MNHVLCGAALALWSLGLSACNDGLETLCAHDVPVVHRELSGALARLEPSAIEAGRQPASLTPAKASSRRPQLPSDQKAVWKDWAEDRLSEFQDTMELLKSYPEQSQARVLLSRASDEIVDFYGYIKTGDLNRMRETLGRVQTAVNEATALACPQTAAAYLTR